MVVRRLASLPARFLPWAIALPLAAFAAYGAVSLPGLVRAWRLSPVTLPVALAWLAGAAIPIVLARRGSMRWTIVTAIVVATAFRVALALLVAGRAPPGDAHYYLQLAENLRAGRGFEVFEPFMGVETRALFPPLYPTLLAIWGVVLGGSTAALVALGCVIDGATALLITLLARALGLPRAGRLAAWLYLVWPSVLLSAPLAQKEGLCALLAVLLALLWVRFAQAARPGMREAGAIGVAAGLLALAQPGEIPLAALFGVVAVGGGVRRLLILGATAIPAAAAAVMLPWWVRNAIVFHGFVPLTSAGGYGFWVGNNPDANGHWVPPPPRLRGLPEITYGKAAGRIAVAWIEANPIAFARTTVAKVLRGWGIAEFGAGRLRDMKPAVGPLVTGALFLLTQAAQFTLLGAAAVASRIERTPGARTLLLLVLACLAQTLFFGSLFEFGERHRDFATPFLLLLGVCGLPPIKHGRG